MRSFARPKIPLSFRPPKQAVRAFFFFPGKCFPYQKQLFAAPRFRPFFPVGFAFFEPVRFNGFLPRQPFPERGIFFKKPKAVVSPKTQKLWLSFAKNPSFS